MSKMGVKIPSAPTALMPSTVHSEQSRAQTVLGGRENGLVVRVGCARIHGRNSGAANYLLFHIRRLRNLTSDL